MNIDVYSKVVFQIVATLKVVPIRFFSDQKRKTISDRSSNIGYFILDIDHSKI